MKILIVDYYGDHYHDQFNTIHIKALERLNADITLMGADSHFQDAANKKVLTIPSKLYKTFSSRFLLSLRSRFWDILKLIYLSFAIQKERYDFIVFLRYEIFCIPFFRTSQNVILFDHSSASTMHSIAKRCALNLIGDNYVHAALNDEIYKHIKTILPNKKVVMIPHGMLSPFHERKYCNLVSANKSFVFCSATSSCDEELLHHIIFSDKVKNYLKARDLQLLVKCKTCFESNETITRIEGFINQEDYEYLIANAVAVFLPYNHDFGYRVSGVFFECVANETPVIASSIPSFLAYAENGQPLFTINDDAGFIEALSHLSQHLGKWDCSKFSPDIYWERIIKNN